MKHLKIGIGYGESITVVYFQSVAVRQLTLYFGFFCQQFWRVQAD